MQHMSFPSLFLSAPKCSFVEEEVSASKGSFYAWQVENSAPVMSVISEVMLRLWRLLGWTNEHPSMTMDH